VNNVFIPKR